MEHKLLQGGEVYLPFARSRIKALRATGMAYASQKFDMGDATVRVRIEPGHEYIEIEGGGALYMESGLLSWTFPGEMNPERYDPAKLNFMDIAHGKDDKYINQIYTTPVKNIGKPNNRPLTVDGMDSRAIGYKHSLDAEVDSKRKTAAQEATVIKKLTLGYFPASMWTGKMRSFLQAQYGAAQDSPTQHLAIELTGGGLPLLYYTVGDDKVQFGQTPHGSPGVMTAADGTYWLINITHPSDSPILVDACAIKQKSAGAISLFRYINDPDAVISAEDRRKAESYIFSASEIDLTSKKRVGSFDPGYDGAQAWAMHYGWKFNGTGSTASIVVHETIGEFSDPAHGRTFGDRRWKSTVIHLDFSYSPVEDMPPDSSWITVGGRKISGGEWIDGWGSYNLFIPSDDETTMDLLSIATDRFNVATELVFHDVPIYGYYVDNVWSVLTVSRTGPDSTYEYEHDLEGISLPPDLNLEALDAVDYSQYGATQYGFHSKFVTKTVAGKMMTVKFAGVVIAGKISSDSVVEKTLTVGDTNYELQTFTAEQRYSMPDYPVLYEISWPGLPLPDGAPVSAGNRFSWQYRTASFRQDTRFSSSFVYWSIVIPFGDAEALYIPTYEAEDIHGPYIASLTSGDQQHFNRGWIAGAFPGPPPYLTATDTGAGAGRWHPSNGVSLSGTPAYSTESVPANSPQFYAVKVFSNATPNGAEGMPGGSYYGLFNVSIDFPIYSRTMAVVCSTGKRYAGSDALPRSLPESVPTSPRFIGWA